MRSRRADKPVIVMDVGGVLVNFDLKPLFATLSKRLGKKVRVPSAVTLLDKLFSPVQTGKVHFDHLIPALNAFLGVSMAPRFWRDLSCSIFQRNPCAFRSISWINSFVSINLQ